LTDMSLSEICDGKYSLHDSSLDEFNIDYLARKIVMAVRLVAENNKAIKILFAGVDRLSGKIALDAKNDEIILDFELHEPSKLKLYSSSRTSLSFFFQKMEVSWA